MQQPDIAHQDDHDDGILIVEVNQSFWLLDGEPHLSRMMANQKPYPTPVRCLNLKSLEDLTALLPDGLRPDSLWAVHPAIIARLKQDDELLAVELVQTH